MPLLSHSFPIVLRHIPSFVHCLSQISDIWHEDCIAYKIWAKTELLHITCVSSPHIETAIFPLLFHYAIKDHKNALNLERIRYAAHLAKKYHHGTSAHHMVLIKTAIFPLLFQCFTRALRDLASFYPLLIVSTVVINFPSVLLKFAIAFPFFSHCFTSYSLICSLFIPNFRHMAWRLHCLQNLGKNWTSAHHMCVISSYRNCNFSIAFPLRDNGPTSEPQFYLASFYPLPILSTVFLRVSVFQAFYSNFPLLSHFFHCFIS